MSWPENITEASDPTFSLKTGLRLVEEAAVVEKLTCIFEITVPNDEI